MKKKTVKDIFIESFYEIAQYKNVDKITIKDITENCGYSSATFYRHFQDKYDLITWAYSHEVEEIMNKVGKNCCWEQTLEAGAKLFEEEKNYLANLFLHTNGQDCFLYSMIEVHYKALKDYIQMTLNQELTPEIKIYIRTYCFSTVFLTYEWILGHFQMTSSQLSQIYKNILPSPLVPYLIKKEF